MPPETVQRPDWCPVPSCECLGSMQDALCAGRLSALEAQEEDFRFKSRLCWKTHEGRAKRVRGILMDAADVQDLYQLISLLKEAA